MRLELLLIIVGQPQDITESDSDIKGESLRYWMSQLVLGDCISANNAFAEVIYIRADSSPLVVTYMIHPGMMYLDIP